VAEVERPRSTQQVVCGAPWATRAQASSPWRATPDSARDSPISSPASTSGQSRGRRSRMFDTGTRADTCRPSSAAAAAAAAAPALHAPPPPSPRPPTAAAACSSPASGLAAARACTPARGCRRRQSSSAPTRPHSLTRRDPGRAAAPASAIGGAPLAAWSVPQGR
jgi:hypothetical protein